MIHSRLLLLQCVFVPSLMPYCYCLFREKYFRTNWIFHAKTESIEATVASSFSRLRWYSFKCLYNKLRFCVQCAICICTVLFGRYLVMIISKYCLVVGVCTQISQHIFNNQAELIWIMQTWIASSTMKLNTLLSFDSLQKQQQCYWLCSCGSHSHYIPSQYKRNLCTHTWLY